MPPLTDFSSSADRRHLVIVGGGPAAHRLAEAVHSRDAGSRYRVTVIGEEAHRPYDRVALSTMLAGDVDLTLGDRGMWDAVAFRAGERVTDIDAPAETVRTDVGTRSSTTNWCWPPGPSPSCRRSPARMPPAASSTAPSTTSRCCWPRWRG